MEKEREQEGFTEVEDVISRIAEEDEEEASAEEVQETSAQEETEEEAKEEAEEEKGEKGKGETALYKALLDKMAELERRLAAGESTSNMQDDLDELTRLTLEVQDMKREMEIRDVVPDLFGEFAEPLPEAEAEKFIGGMAVLTQALSAAYDLPIRESAQRLREFLKDYMSKASGGTKSKSKVPEPSATKENPMAKGKPAPATKPKPKNVNFDAIFKSLGLD